MGWYGKGRKRREWEGDEEGWVNKWGLERRGKTKIGKQEVLSIEKGYLLYSQSDIVLSFYPSFFLSLSLLLAQPTTSPLLYTLWTRPFPFPPLSLSVLDSNLSFLHNLHPPPSTSFVPAPPTVCTQACYAPAGQLGRKLSLLSH